MILEAFLDRFGEHFEVFFDEIEHASVTPPQHLFVLDPLWNDPSRPECVFKHRSILKLCLESKTSERNQNGSEIINKSIQRTFSQTSLTCPCAGINSQHFSGHISTCPCVTIIFQHFPGHLLHVHVPA